ncbi:hypothetical protein B6V74_12215 [Thioclava sp. F42-5]|uniref:hypothetical protein n=1 Tax=Thioclava sp. F42-5 TaxID=1973005 RepID=UPI000B5427F6|nr:hypothetical protein [Thioclava sp. F42-5]OWY08592.1 hypothetical protein B6V74_12215 [Thioclava sp. F42-5]
MTQSESHPPAPLRPLFRSWGFWALLAGAAALILVFVQISGIANGPQPSAGSQIGEISGEIKRSAWRSFFGLAPKPVEPQPLPASSYLGLAAPVLGILAIVLAGIAAALRENWRLPSYAVSLGIAAIVFQYVWWIALLVAGVVLLVTIIANLGEIFSF